jgi:hypothetical protein
VQPARLEAAMRMLPLAVIVGALAVGNHVAAQDTPTPKPTYASGTGRLRILGGGGTSARRCALPDTTERELNTTVTIDGKSYRCVQVLNQHFQWIGVAWTPVPSQPQSSN